MEQTRQIGFISLSLAFIAGYADAVTFTSANELFSTHVTGNFIVFAYDIVKGADTSAWIKLLSFPVFILSVMIAGRTDLKNKNPYTLLIAEGIILMLAAVIVFLIKSALLPSGWLTHFAEMLIVFAMGLQNAFGRLYTKVTHGPTTVMTGNVTQATLDMIHILSVHQPGKEKTENLKKQILMITSFIVGSLAGAFLALEFGLSVVAIPALPMILIFLYFKQQFK